MVEDAHADCLTQHTTASIHSCSTPAGRNLSWVEDSSQLRATWLCVSWVSSLPASSRPAGRWNQQLLPHPPDNSVPGLYSILNPPRVSILHRARLYGQSSIASLKPQ